jgi:predicted ATPase
MDSTRAVKRAHRKLRGNPFFLEELTWAAVERGSQASSQPVPDTIQAVLATRIDRLPPADKRLLQTAAVIGPEVPIPLLHAVTALPEAALHDNLGRLQAAEFLVETPAGPGLTYIFKHVLTQEVAYQSLLRRTRQQVHQRIAQVVEAQFPTTAETQPVWVAQHYTEAGCIEPAIAYWQRAGEQALQRSANLEAVQHLTKGLALLATLPETPARAQQELDLLIALGPALMATKGYATPEVEQTYARARALCQQVGEMPQLFPTLWGLWRFYEGQGALPTARELGEQLYRLAQRTAAPMHLLEAHNTLGSTLFFLGEYAAAWRHLEQGIALIDPTTQRALVLSHDMVPGVACLTVAALTLWCLGFPAQAVRRCQEALALAQALDHPQSLVRAQHYAAFLHHRRREVPAVQAQAEALLTLATAQGFPLFAGLATCWQGWVLAMQGQGEAGLAQLRQGLTALLATGETLAWSRFLVLLAEAVGHAGQIDEGLRLLAEALTAMAERGRGESLAEAYRLQGEFLLRLATPDATQAEACFQQALAIAQRQQAKSWELRAAMSLSHLWQRQGKCAAARQLLAPIYGWFTEGFDTLDLQEAKALLEAL